MGTLSASFSKVSLLSVIRMLRVGVPHGKTHKYGGGTSTCLNGPWGLRSAVKAWEAHNRPVVVFLYTRVLVAGVRVQTRGPTIVACGRGRGCTTLAGAQKDAEK